MGCSGNLSFRDISGFDTDVAVITHSGEDANAQLGSGDSEGDLGDTTLRDSFQSSEKGGSDDNHDL